MKFSFEKRLGSSLALFLSLWRHLAQVPPLTPILNHFSWQMLHSSIVSLSSYLWKLWCICHSSSGRGSLERGFEYGYVSRKGSGIDGGGTRDTSGARDAIVDLGTGLGARDLVIGDPNGDSNCGALLAMRVFRDGVGEWSSP
jgi:hypothetical protein